MRRVAVIAAALAIDLCAGQLPNRLHPVAAIGRLVAAAWGRPRGRGDFGRGTIATVWVGGVALVAGWCADRVTRRGGVPGLFLESLLVSQLFSLSGLLRGARKVHDCLVADDLPAARAEVAMLVSRRTASLDATDVACAAVESVAENLGDSVVAPLFWYRVGGLPLLLLYRAVNTADAMVGYRDEREYLGKTVARFDDLLNLIPARITAPLIAASAPLVGASASSALRALRTEATRTPSPNSGWPMAAVAGAFGVILDKPGAYSLAGGPDRPGPQTLAAMERLAAITTLVWLAVLGGTEGVRRAAAAS
jgi:adenosylcobinamide-phosphate synthase